MSGLLLSGISAADGITFLTPLPNEVLGFAIVFVLLSIIYMRMIRHGDDVLRQSRFQIRNMIHIIVTVVMVMLISSPQSLQVLINIIYIIWFHGIARIIPVLGNTATFPLRWLYLARHVANEIEENGYGFEIYDLDPYQGAQDWFPGQENNVALMIIIILLIIGLLFVFKLLIKKDFEHDIIDPTLQEERQSLDNRQQQKHGWRNKNQVRVVYANFLKLIKRKKHFNTCIRH